MSPRMPRLHQTRRDPNDMCDCGHTAGQHSHRSCELCPCSGFDDYQQRVNSKRRSNETNGGSK